MQLDPHTALQAAGLAARDRRALADADRLARSVRRPVVRAADRAPARPPRAAPARPAPASVDARRTSLARAVPRARAGHST